MRFDLEGKLIDYNLTALPLLTSWSCKNGQKPQTGAEDLNAIIQQCFRESRSETLEIRFSDLILSFDAVPFAEAGYIGFYGFDVRSLKEADRGTIAGIHLHA